MKKEPNKEHVKFDKFGKLDQKVEETIQEVESMGKRKFVLKAFHTSFAGAAVWAVLLNLVIETLGRMPTTSVWGGFQFLFNEPLIFLYKEKSQPIRLTFRKRVMVTAYSQSAPRPW